MGDDAGGLGLSLIIKQLGSCDKRSRDKALRLLLESWIPSQPNLTDDIMNELWKGLFSCVWDADFQSGDLIDRLSSLLPRLHDSSPSLQYFSSFLFTMHREWPDIDVLRLEKFYLFIRRFLHHSFDFLKNRSWDLDLTSRLISLLEDACFLVKPGKTISFGVSYHIASVFLEELRPFLPLPPEVLEIVFKPFISVMGSLPDQVLLGKIKSNMFDVLVKMGNKLLEVKNLGDDEVNDDDDDDDVVVLGTIAWSMGFSSVFFGLAKSVECCQGNMRKNRKALFVLYIGFLRLEHYAASAGLDKTKVNGAVSKKRTINGQNPELNIEGDAEGGGTTAKSGEKRSGGSRKMIDLDTECKLSISYAPKREPSLIFDKKKKKKKKKASSDSGGKKGKKKKSVDAAEAILSWYDAVEDVASACELPKTKVNDTMSKKRKRAKTINGQNPEQNIEGDAEGGGSGGKKGKKKKNVAAEAACELPKTKVNGTLSKKRMRANSMNGQNPELNIKGDAEGGTTAKSGEKRSGGSDLLGTGCEMPGMRRNSRISTKSCPPCNGKVIGDPGFGSAQYSDRGSFSSDLILEMSGDEFYGRILMHLLSTCDL